MKMNSKLRRILLTVCSAALLVCVTVGATVAYLTSTDKVENTFTVGQVKISLDEAAVGPDGKALEGNDAKRVNSNSYKLMPGGEYDKDPTIHIDNSSEEAYLRVNVAVSNTAKVDALFQKYDYAEAGITAILEGLDLSIWNITSSVEGDVRNYVLTLKANDSKISGETADIVLFTGVNVPEEFTNEDILELNNTTITITAYAIQADGFDSLNDAWAATFGKPESEGE